MSWGTWLLIGPEMRDKLIGLVLLIGLIACSDEDLPAGIYDYQVERLLSGQSGSKTWFQVTASTNCADSVKLVFDLIENTSNDSLDVSMITGCESFNSTNYIGRASASKALGRQLFTDSLIFRSGDFWIIEEITSKQLLIDDGDKESRFLKAD